MLSPKKFLYLFIYTACGTKGFLNFHKAAGFFQDVRDFHGRRKKLHFFTFRLLIFPYPVFVIKQDLDPD
jgi:hypothetical protein